MIELQRVEEIVPGMEWTSTVTIPTEDRDAEASVKVSDVLRWLDEAGYVQVWP